MNFCSIAHRYHSRVEFLADIELIATNCEQYNGSESRFTKNAKHILEYARLQLDEVRILFENIPIMQINWLNYGIRY